MKKTFAIAATLAIVFAIIALPASAAQCPNSQGGSHQSWNQNHRGGHDFDRNRHNNGFMRFLMMRNLMQNNNCSNCQNGCSNCSDCQNGCSNCQDCQNGYGAPSFGGSSCSR